MEFNKLHKIIGAAVFFLAFFVYFSTTQVSVSFWDCGEFIASSVLLQVPHPPGTPFFLILGRFFSMIPFGEDLAFRVNMISVLILCIHRSLCLFDNCKIDKKLQ